MKPIWFCLTLLGMSLVAASRAEVQTDTIAGIVNRYARVLFIDSCNSALVVDKPAGFAAGDKILIIQMKGAAINTDDASTFGIITGLGNAGNYEFATIDAVDSRTFVLRYKLAQQYTVAGLVQVVRVPTYTNVVLSGIVTGKPWDGNTGDVVAISASGTVRMNMNIDVRGLGFRGGESVAEGGISMEGWRYPAINPDGGMKGEGITIPLTSYYAGRGKLANGGGGGNASSAGGGGGSNYGNGGTGGKQSSEHDALAIGGIGGATLTYSNTAKDIFLGGGGGAAGPPDAGFSAPGERGAGIVIIQATHLACTNDSILASGSSVSYAITDTSASEGGGAGGGGAGVVLLDVDNIDSNVVVQVNGGKGGDTKQSNYCYGPGGGCVWVSLASQPATLLASTSGGSSGTSTVCNNQPYGATNGQGGAVVTGLQIPEGTVPR